MFPRPYKAVFVEPFCSSKGLTCATVRHSAAGGDSTHRDLVDTVAASKVVQVPCHAHHVQSCQLALLYSDWEVLFTTLSSIPRKDHRGFHELRKQAIVHSDPRTPSLLPACEYSIFSHAFLCSAHTHVEMLRPDYLKTELAPDCLLNSICEGFSKC